MDERQLEEECFRLRGELGHHTPTIRFIVAPLYQTAPRQAIEQSYKAVVLEIEPLGELPDGHGLASREPFDGQALVGLAARRVLLRVRTNMVRHKLEREKLIKVLPQRRHGV